MKQLIKKTSLFLSLFSSTSTLVCCALPALFVGLGAGAVFAGLTSAIPQLIWVSEHKVSVFIIAGVLLTLSGYLELKNKDQVCDISQEDICRQTRSWSGFIWRLSLIFYGIGLFFAFALPLFF
jgi:hypothetical protein